MDFPETMRALAEVYSCVLAEKPLCEKEEWKKASAKAPAFPSFRAAAKQSSVVFWIATGQKPLAMTVCPLSPFFDRRLDWLYLILNKGSFRPVIQINTEI
jgi:hypothetical protein